MIDITWAHVLCCCGSQYLDLKFLEQNLPLLAVSDKLLNVYIYGYQLINCLFLKQHTVPKCHTQKTHKTNESCQLDQTSWKKTEYYSIV